MFSAALAVAATPVFQSKGYEGDCLPYPIFPGIYNVILMSKGTFPTWMHMKLNHIQYLKLRLKFLYIQMIFNINV